MEMPKWSASDRCYLLARKSCRWSFPSWRRSWKCRSWTAISDPGSRVPVPAGWHRRRPPPP